MKVGPNPAQTMHLNGWEIGDILQRKQSDYVQTIIITRIGEENILYREKYTEQEGMEQAEFGNIMFRDGWFKVGEDKNRKSAAGFWGRVAWNLMQKNKTMRTLLNDISFDFDPDKGELGPKCGPEILDRIKALNLRKDA